MTRIYFDFEFTGLHQNTTPISLGIISDCGKTFYAEFWDYDRNQVDQWIEENVIKKLRFSPPPEGQYFRMSRVLAKPGENSLYDGYSVELRGDKTSIKEQLEAWLKQFDRVEVWGDCLAYDWMLFCQLFGHAFNIPKNVYYMPFDLCTLFKSRGIDPDINREDFARGGEYWYPEDQIQKHNALWDAKVIKACVDRINTPLKSHQIPLNRVPRTLAGDVAPEQTVVHAGLVDQLEREITDLKRELLDRGSKLDAAQAEISLLRQKYAGRVNDDQKYLVEPLCSAETQVDELRAELAKKDGQIEAILKERDAAIDRLDADRQQAEIDLRRKFAETIAFLIEEQYQNITSEYDRGFHNGLYGAFGAITGKDHWTGFQTKQVENKLIEQIQTTLETAERNFVELDRAMSTNLPGLAKAAYGCGLKSLREAIRTARGE